MEQCITHSIIHISIIVPIFLELFGLQFNLQILQIFCLISFASYDIYRKQESNNRS